MLVAARLERVINELSFAEVLYGVLGSRHAVVSSELHSEPAVRPW